MSVGSASLIAMAARWSADSVLDLAPDESSRRSGAGLGRPAPWRGAGVAGDVLWGLCAGSGKNPYQVVVDLSGPAYKCSCPSRKFPCKHALGLLLNWANGTLPEESAPADFAAAWLADRRARAEKAEKSVVRTDPGDSGSSAGSGTVKDEAAAARRVQQRAQRVANGLAELQSWLRDQVLVGLSATPTARGRARSRERDRGADGRCAGTGRGRRPARAVRGSRVGRGVAGTAAGRVRAAAPARPARTSGSPTCRPSSPPPSGPGSGTRPAGRTFSPAGGNRPLGGARRPRPARRAGPRTPGLAARARQRPVGDAADVRRARRGGRDGAGGWQDPDTARLRPGTELHASLHYYPGQPALRAAAGERHAQPARVQRPAPCRGRRCPAGLLRRGPGTRSLADRVAGPAHRDAGAAR